MSIIEWASQTEGVASVVNVAVFILENKTLFLLKKKNLCGKFRLFEFNKLSKS